MALGLWGEAGIGKTWLLEKILQSTGFQHKTVNVNISVSDLLQVLPRPKRLPVWAEHSLERVARGEYLATLSHADALAALLGALAPMVLYFEDLHDASDDRLELLDALAKLVLRTRGVALIVTSRNVPPEPFEAFKLEPLSSTESKTLLEAQINADLPVQASTWIYARAAGNPLFTLEFLRFLTRGGFAWNDGNRWHWRVPPNDLMPVTVEALIERLLDQSLHSGALQEVLEAKALLGLGATQPLWADVAGVSLEILLEAQHELEQHNLLVNLEFAHPLFAEVTLKRLTLERRQVLARRALLTLQNDPIAAAGFVEDAGLEPDQALGCYERATEFATAQGNEVKAAQFKARAVEYATGEERGHLALEVARKLQHIDLNEAARLADIALDAQPNDTQTILFRAGLFATQGLLTDLNALLERLPQTERVGSTWLIQVLKLYSASEDVAAVLKLCQDHPELLETSDLDVRYDIALALANSGDENRARALVERSLGQPELSLELRAKFTGLYGAIRNNQGEYLEAEKLLSQALSYAEQAGLVRGQVAAYYNRSNARRRLGWQSEMTADLMEALRLSGELGDGKRYAHLQTALARTLIDVADYERAEELLLESRSTLERMGISYGLIESESQLSTLYGVWSSPHGRVLELKYARQALEHARKLGNPVALVDTLFYTACAESSQGFAAKGLGLAEEMFDLHKTIDAPARISDAYFARAKALEALGRSEEALEDFRQAATSIKVPVRAQRRWLEVDRLTHDLESARTRLAWFEKHGFLNAVSAVHQYFPELEGAKDSQRVTLAETLPAPLRLEVLGSLQLRQNNISKPMRGQKRKELLAYLLEARIAGCSEVRVFELLEMLYPESSPEEAADALKQLVFQIRSSYGQSMIASTGNGYALGAVGSDAEDFLAQGDTQLWRGLYLQADVQSRDENVREALYQALRSSLATTIENNPKEAVRLGRILNDAEPYDLEVLSLSLQAFRLAGDHRGLLRFFAAGRERFLEIGEELPERWQDFLTAQSA